MIRQHGVLESVGSSPTTLNSPPRAASPTGPRRPGGPDDCLIPAQGGAKSALAFRGSKSPTCRSLSRHGTQTRQSGQAQTLAILWVRLPPVLSTSARSTSGEVAALSTRQEGFNSPTGHCDQVAEPADARASEARAFGRGSATLPLVTASKEMTSDCHSAQARK